MTAASSPSSAELYSSMRNAAHSAASAAVLDLYCGSSRGDAAAAAGIPSGAEGCLSDRVTPRCSPGASPGVSPADLQAAMNGPTGIDAAALRLMLGGGRHHGGLPPLPVLGVGSSMTGISSQPPGLRHPHHLEASAFYLPPVRHSHVAFEFS